MVFVYKSVTVTVILNNRLQKREHSCILSVTLFRHGSLSSEDALLGRRVYFKYIKFKAHLHYSLFCIFFGNFLVSWISLFRYWIISYYCSTIFYAVLAKISVWFRNGKINHTNFRVASVSTKTSLAYCHLRSSLKRAKILVSCLFTFQT
jgi:hypothetical protein